MKAVRCFLLLLLQKAVQCIWVAHHGTADKHNHVQAFHLLKQHWELLYKHNCLDR